MKIQIHKNDYNVVCQSAEAIHPNWSSNRLWNNCSSRVLNMLLFAYAASRTSVASIIVYCYICLSSETSFASSNSLHWPLQVDKNVGTQHSSSSSKKLRSFTSKAEPSRLHYSPDYYRHQLDYEEGSIEELDQQLHWKNVPQSTGIYLYKLCMLFYWSESTEACVLANRHQSGIRTILGSVDIEGWNIQEDKKPSPNELRFNFTP